MKFWKKTKFKEIIDKKNLFILSSIFVSLTVGLLSGASCPKTKIEDTSNYISNVVKNDTVSQGLLPITIESFDGTSLPDSEAEFLRLYGVFRQERITFASGYNLTKDETITIDELDASENLSAVYIGSTTGSDEYKDHYRDVTYPVEVIFPFVRYDSVSNQTACLSMTQAKVVLKKRGIDKVEYDNDDYKTLIATPIYINVKGEVIKFVIQNIFYDDTYYIKDLKRSIGEFFITSYYFPKTVRKQNAYFMSSYPYENKYFIEYINSVYKDRNCLLKCATDQGKNLKNEIDVKRITNFYGVSSQTSFYETTMITIAAMFALVTFVLLYYFYDKYDFNLLISHFIILFIPFIIFFFINLITNNVFIFSEVGTKTNAILMFVYIFGFSIFYFVKKFQKRSIRKGAKANEELDI